MRHRAGIVTILLTTLVATVVANSFHADMDQSPRSSFPEPRRSAGTPRIVLPTAAEADDFYSRDLDKEQLGKLLFFDKILSGNRNISCATCHHPLAWTGDGLSLSCGEGARGLGVTRDTGSGEDSIHERVPRNAPHLFNLGAREFTRLFHDGRVEVNPGRPSGFDSPAGDDLPLGLDNVFAAQAMFPVTSMTEMAGQAGENPVADAASAGQLPEVWQLLAERLRDNPEYVQWFIDAFDDVNHAGEITFVHAANALAAFQSAAWRADNSPFDRYLRGDRQALSVSAQHGMRLFYGRANCASCHSGTFQTNHEFRAVGMPQIGPGKGDNLEGYDDGLDDFGRERVTGQAIDRFRFRVPSLRNVAVTGPWGHDGAYNDLESAVRHLLDPLSQLELYDPDQAVLPSRPDLDAVDFVCMSDAQRRAAIEAAVEIRPVQLSDREIDYLLDFLYALTDRDSLDMRDDVPPRVPSGLPVFD